MTQAILWAEARERVRRQVFALEVYYKYRMWDRSPFGHAYRSMLIAAQLRSPREFLRITYSGS